VEESIEPWQTLDMEKDKYFKIRMSSLIPAQATQFDLYLFINQHFVLYLRSGDHLSSEKIDALNNRGSDLFYVPETQRQSYKDYVSQQLKGSDLNVRQKAQVLRETSLALVEEIYEQPDVHRALTDSKALIDQFVNFMDEEPEGMAHLISLSSHDFYTFNHSLDVCIYSLGLGQTASYKPEDLRELGRGALFHDIGKRNVSVDIICKTGPLTDVEWAQMQKHPTYGLKILSEQDVSDAIRACCFEHHESFLGNGYPQQLTGPEIHPMARIVALTDTYDALTSKRSYNVPMQPMAALNFMKEKLAGRYDPDLLKAMYSVLFKMEKTEATG
jgi:HD-GYP domain-containing protein (c-di-GMP phosphodiesterase class II)